MNTHDDTGWAVIKLTLAWAGMIIGAIDAIKVLTAVALILTIVFSAYQIIKIRRDLKRQEKLDAFEARLQKSDD